MPNPGETILHYEILELLGRGGMGQVFRALDTKLKRDVALKFILQGQLNDEQRQRLIIEARAVARLDHNNIGVLHTIEESGDELFLVMALYEGESLEEKLGKGALNIETSLALFKQVLKGLSHAHAKGIIHRDIKPANIFISTEGQVRILDFGLARMPDSDLSHKGQMLGTPSYASPEQLRAETVDLRTDIWSLGVLLFQMLTGELPFEGKFPQVMIAILKEDPKPLSQFIAHPALESVIEQCLAKDKRERFESCEVLLDALNSLKQHTMSLKPIAANSRLTRPGRQLFIGREAEISELISRLKDEDTTLLSIVGIGGAGKTSLAQAVMKDEGLNDAYPDGVFFVPLEAVEDANQIPFEVANAINFQLAGHEPWLELSNLLTDKKLLLALDNLEQLIETAALELDDLLNASPNLTLLVTSREVVNLTGEIIFELKGLSLPPSLASDFHAYGATELFIRSAKRFKRSFDWKKDKEHILSVCQQLEGWPLGIELAVAWIRQLPASDIAAQLKENLDFLTTRSRTHASRHKSARAAFEYSWALLTDQERTALAKLSVFKGGFTNEAALLVTGTALPRLASLLDKSLLNASGEGRYAFHPLLLHYCTEKLTDMPSQSSAHHEHASYYLTLVSTLGLQGVFAHLALFDKELANIRAAWQWAVEHAEFKLLKSAVFTLCEYYDLRAKYTEGAGLIREALNQIQNQSAVDQATLATLMVNWGFLVFALGKTDEPVQLAKKALARVEQLEEPRTVMIAHHILASKAQDEIRFEDSKAHFGQCLDLARQLNDHEWIAHYQLNLGFSEFYLHNLDKALQEVTASLASSRAFGSALSQTMSLFHLAYVHIALRDLQTALELLLEALQLSEDNGFETRRLYIMSALATCHYGLGHIDTAEQLSLEVLASPQSNYLVNPTLHALPVLARVATVKARFDDALVYYKQAIKLALEGQREPNVYSALTYFAELLDKQGRSEEACALLVFTLTKGYLYPTILVDARSLLEHFENSLTPDVLDNARQQAELLNLEGILDHYQLR